MLGIQSPRNDGRVVKYLPTGPNENYSSMELPGEDKVIVTIPWSVRLCRKVEGGRKVFK